MTQIMEDEHCALPQQRITSMTIEQTMPIDRSMGAFGNQMRGTYAFQYSHEKFPKDVLAFPGEMQQQSIRSQRSISTSYTTYQTHSLTVHSNSSTLPLFFFSIDRSIDTWTGMLSGLISFCTTCIDEDRGSMQSLVIFFPVLDLLCDMRFLSLCMPDDRRALV